MNSVYLCRDEVPLRGPIRERTLFSITSMSTSTRELSAPSESHVRSLVCQTSIREVSVAADVACACLPTITSSPQGGCCSGAPTLSLSRDRRCARLAGRPDEGRCMASVAPASIVLDTMGGCAWYGMTPCLLQKARVRLLRLSKSSFGSFGLDKTPSRSLGRLSAGQPVS